MNQHFYFKNVSEKDKKKAENYLEKRLQKINKLLSEDDQLASKCHVSIEYHEKHNCYTESIKVEMPFVTLHAEEHSHDLCKPIDLMVERLLSQIKKQKAKIRHENSRDYRAHRSIKTKIIHEKELEKISESIAAY